MNGLYVGLISGTSMDGIDAALLDMSSDTGPAIIAGCTTPYESSIARDVRHIVEGWERVSLDDFGQLDARLGEAFAAAALALLHREGLDRKDVIAIGSHGQTVRHRADLQPPFTLQIGDPSIIAARTGIATVADFRRRDIALGGEGAPLVPPFHAAVLGSVDEDRAVVNLGGIGNVSLLPAGRPVTGFDTGPANGLLDMWAQRHGRGQYDEDGKWSATGQVSRPLLDACLADPYFAMPAPKSTGKEHFNAGWLDQRLKTMPDPLAPADVAATLCELSAATVADAVLSAARAGDCNIGRIFVCGGGAHNADLLRRLARRLPGRAVVSTATAGLDPDLVEAAAFAWLAHRAIAREPGNAPGVTGASAETILGAIYPTFRA